MDVGPMPPRTQADLAEVGCRWRKLHPLVIRYRPGELVYHTGSYAAGAGMLCSGVIVDRPSDSSRCPELIGPGGFFGIEVLLSPPLGVHQTSGRALTDVEVAFVERQALRLEIAADSSLCEALLAYVAARFIDARTSRWVLPPTREAAQVRRRIASCLLQLAQMCGTREDDQGRLIRLPKEITPHALSSILSVSTASVSRLLSDHDLGFAKMQTRKAGPCGSSVRGLLIVVERLSKIANQLPPASESPGERGAAP